MVLFTAAPSGGRMQGESAKPGRMARRNSSKPSVSVTVTSLSSHFLIVIDSFPGSEEG